jgi:radical SAM/SPASM domain protein of ACGX system
MENKRAFGFQWHLTEQCDQKCKHCYSVAEQKNHLVGRELNVDECFGIVDKILAFCKENECEPGIGISGGDPLLADYFWDVAAYLKEKNINFSLLGNPFHLDRAICDRLLGLGCRSYQMSLDGLEKTHDSVRKRSSFRATIGALELLKSTGIKTAIMNTVTANNFSELTKLIQLAADLEVDLFGFARYCPTDMDLVSMIQPLDYKELLGAVWEMYSSLSERDTIFSLKDHLFKLFLYEKGLFKPSSEKIVSDGCGCGVRHCAILPDGQIYACRRFISPVGNLNTTTMEEIFFGDEMARYRQIETLEGCKDCNLLYHCRGCHATSFGAYGSFFNRDPQCWRFL